jgi:hypothetical protein
MKIEFQILAERVDRADERRDFERIKAISVAKWTS